MFTRCHEAARGCAVAAIAALCVACGSSGPVAQTSSGVAPTSARVTESEQKTIVTARHAPVPAADDPREVLVFVREGSVWMMRPDGSEPLQLTARAAEGEDRRPALSPSGHAIAYAGWDAGTHRIFVLALADMRPWAVAAESDRDDEPTWDPTGTQIAFMRGDPNVRRDLYRVRTAPAGDRVRAAPGSGDDAVAPAVPELLVRGGDDHPEAVGAPAWSPDGKRIAFAADRRLGKGTLLWTYDVEKHKMRQLTPAQRGAWHLRDRDPAWSPDGTTVVFASNRHATSSDDREDTDIYSIRADGTGLARLSDDPGTATDPVYSPDGKRIVFVSDRDRVHGYETELYAMAATGGIQRRITRDERPQNRAPSPGRVTQ